jgi:hypothetical protein
MMAALASGCGHEQTGGPAAAPEPDEATLRYGYGPVRDKSITYQPDVVVVQGGPKAIRSARANGLVWTIDGRAPGADELKPGNVMFVTGRAVGRVVDVQPTGRDLAVTVMPVQLTDIIRNGHFKIDQHIPIGSLTFQETPDFPAQLAMADSGTARPHLTRWEIGPHHRPFIVPAMTVIDALTEDGLLPPTKKVRERGSVDVTVGSWEVRLYASSTAPLNGTGDSGPDKIGMRIRYSNGLRASLQFALLVKDLRLISDVPIENGRTSSTPDMQLEGIKGIDVDLAAGIDYSGNNAKVRAELPVNLYVDVPPSPATFGIPLVFSIRFRFIVETALSGNNSTLAAHGRWALSGPIGVVGGVISPKLELFEEESLLKSLDGINIGASGIVLAAAVVMSGGVGTPVANAGPYLKQVFSLGLTKGSVLGAPLVTCRGESVNYNLGVGIGLSLSNGAWDTLTKKFMPAAIPMSLDVGTEKMWTVSQRTRTIPNVPICRQ